MTLPKTPAEIQAMDAKSRAILAKLVYEVLTTGFYTVTGPDGKTAQVPLLAGTFVREAMRYILATSADAPESPDEALLAEARKRFGGGLPPVSDGPDAATEK